MSHAPLDPAQLAAALATLADATPAAVAAAAHQLGWTAKAVAALVPPAAQGPHPYQRTMVGSAEGWEVMVARWTPGVSCAPHDHGAASGWVLFLRGQFVETAWQRGVAGYAPGASHTHGPGAASRVRAGDLHSCVCDGDGLSLHVYLPAIHGMRVLDVDGRRTLQVADHCGAWLPDDPADILTEEGW